MHPDGPVYIWVDGVGAMGINVFVEIRAELAPGEALIDGPLPDGLMLSGDANNVRMTKLEG